MLFHRYVMTAKAFAHKLGRMKTLERSQKRLRLVHFGWYYGAVAAGLGALCLYAGLSLLAQNDLRGAAAFIGLGCGPSVILGLIATRKVVVTLDKEANIVHVRNVTAFGARVRSAPLGSLKQAHMQTSSNADLAVHRLVLLFHDRERWIVTKMYTSGDGPALALTQINTWMHLHLPERENAENA
jgi:hypothetical protein